jgi:hypothetical protein
MSLCINNDLIWVSVPRCASTSIETAFINSPLSIDNYIFSDSNYYSKHIHVELSKLYSKFGKKETVVIKRNYFDRWLSGLYRMFISYEDNGVELYKKWEDIDNDFIYKTFSPKYIDLLHNPIPNHLNLLNNKLTIIKNLNLNFTPHMLLLSQMYWTGNEVCTYEFDISEMDKFEKFISNRYNFDFKVGKLNESQIIKNNIVKDDELKNWVFNNFEKRFISKNKLI